ncbi:Glutamyl-tRNA(Gln) amidotransferase subunit A [Corynebacterium provencense]|uniref:Glutamyl-tRNA(Gln) amidotransferase subunit A n=1 Tax=Corynebacterium provencense TaxID=1737425 RepID=A0A2Z3Z1D8_9CORY|nr:amidase [Corynebacterium provencense]AWT27413.1 Glutamyl-tRNA(Gln) amidotransferase subunit A [Corynebacterium provencense]
MISDPTQLPIADLRRALDDGSLTSVGLVSAFLDRIRRFDRPAGTASGPEDATLTPEGTVPLNAVVVDNPDALAEAEASDRRRAGGRVLGPLDGIPYTAKDSYMVRGLTVAAGFAVFGLGEETWSSGRAPASCNSLCAYTPSRGVISVRGNWPLVPTKDVVVPHARCMGDLLEILDVLVADDTTARGDFWRVQPWIDIPPASRVRPARYPDLDRSTTPLEGARLGVPRMYVNADPLAGTGPDHRDEVGICGSMGQRVVTSPDVTALWEQLRADIETAGVEVVEVDFPAVTRYEGDRPGAPTVSSRGLVSREFLLAETGVLSAWSWEDFLRANGDPSLHSLTRVDGRDIFPPPRGALPDRYTGQEHDVADYPAVIGSLLSGRPELPPLPELAPSLPAGLAGLEETRRVDLEDWMDSLGLDALIFPAMAGVAPADADVNPRSADTAWRNGIWVANGNVVIRHLGIPTVTVPMGAMEHNNMPVGATLAGRAWDDSRLLSLAAAVEATAPHGTRRTTPTLTCGG